MPGGLNGGWVGPAADLIIAAACLALVVVIARLLRRRRDLARSFQRLAALVAGFIGIVGLSHVVGFVLSPGTGAVLKALAAAAALLTLALFWRLKPQLAALPSLRDIQDANRRLIAEAEAHEGTLRELRHSRDELEARVSERTRDLDDAKRRYELALRGSDVTLFLQDRELRYTWISRPGFGLTIDEIIGRTDDELIPDESRTRIVAIKRAAFETGEDQDAEVSVATPEGVLWFHLHVEPEGPGDGSLQCIYCSAVDITARKENEQKLRFLMRELTHRSKNMLAVILAMARQTSAGSDNAADFLVRFGNRVQALSASYDLLIEESAHGVPFDNLVRSQLAHAADRVGGQINLDGPRVTLSSDATQHVGLALHELATNAAKYGALSTPAGRVNITWALVPPVDGTGGRFRVDWREEGGPPVTPPSRRGFGQVVIERTVARALDATVELTYAPEGVCWSLDAPLDNVVPAPT